MPALRAASSGYLWLEAGQFHEVAAPTVDVIDTTGAGDAFHGAFALMLAEGHSSDQCARAAVIVAAEKCTRLGGRAGLPDRRRFDALMQA